MRSEYPVDWPAASLDGQWAQLCALSKRLEASDGVCDEAGIWPAGLWDALASAGASRWSIPHDVGEPHLERGAILARYGKLAEGSLTAAFILSQHDAAVRRLAACSDRPTARVCLARIASERAIATVGLSHLTTSRRLGERAVVAIEQPGGAYRITGTIPWVTAAERAEFLVAGAVLDDARQVLFVLPMDRAGLKVDRAFDLAALQASRTSQVHCDGVFVEPHEVLAGPSAEVINLPGLAGTGGLETSALALGQARAALVGLGGELAERGEAQRPADALGERWREAVGHLLELAAGSAKGMTPGELRQVCNALVLDATQAYLTARKGRGFLRSDAAQRWARQALFFLVWSCPGPVARAAIDDFAGVCEP